MWEKFQLYELIEIVRQNSDLDFAKLYHKVQDSQQTSDDVIQIKDLANTITATWLHEFAKVYQNKYLAVQENGDCIGKLDSEVVLIKVHDSNKDIETYIIPYL